MEAQEWSFDLSGWVRMGFQRVSAFPEKMTFPRGHEGCVGFLGGEREREECQVEGEDKWWHRHVGKQLVSLKQGAEQRDWDMGSGMGARKKEIKARKCEAPNREP